MTDTVVGVDLGGTGCRVSVLADGVEVSGDTFPTAELDPAPLDLLADRVRGCLPKATVVTGVGVGATGPVHLTSGVVDNPDTLPAFTGLALAQGLADRLRVPVRIDNDAVAGALAEHAWGPASWSPALLCVTLGTGVGTAYLRDGLPVRGGDGEHAEGGHIAVPGGAPCYCGLGSCWEQVASRRALDAHAGGGPLNDDVAASYAEAVATGLGVLITVLRPLDLVVGGSVARHWPVLAPLVSTRLASWREAAAVGTRIHASDLGERGGARGAALLVERGVGFLALPN